MPQASYRRERHPATGWELLRLTYAAADPEAQTSITFAPEIGSNLLSFSVGGQEFLLDGDRSSGAFRLLGTPILYPMPNRVRDAQFTFEGRPFRFEANNGPNFIHGLVRERPWQCDTPTSINDVLSVTTRYRMAPGDAAWDLFPICNTLELTYSLRPRSVRLDFTVYNEDQTARLPFGLAIHPYFRILGPRESVRIQAPATKWMEAEGLLPTGRLLDLADGPADLRQPTSLAQLNLDDVFWGMAPHKPAAIYYDALSLRLTLAASALFTHAVVYTPQGRPFFCIENQTCSTDAHNLYARGPQEAAHLTILEPGQAARAQIEFTVMTQ